MRRIIIGAMDWLVPMMAYLGAFFLPRHRLALEIVALRQQLAVFKRKQPRPRLNRLDRLFWVALPVFGLGRCSHSGQTRNSAVVRNNSGGPQAKLITS